MFSTRHASQWAVAIAILATAAGSISGCGKKDTPDAIKATPPPENAATKTVATGSKRYDVQAAGKTSVMIDAPLEKFQGNTPKLSGVLDVNAGDLKASSGEVLADLDAFTTHPFTDKDKNDSQTEHAKNWFEIGEKVEQKMRDDYRMARFTIEKIDESSAKSVAEAPEKDGMRTVTLKVSGTLRVHGRSAKKTAVIDVSFKGPPEAPTEITFKTKDPLVASLAEHDVKPRDTTGKFLAGALEAVGKKIDDKAQISVEGSAKPKG